MTRDIDLVVTKPFTESNKVRTLSDMARAMRQSKIADTVAIISKARVPIIKFVTNEGKLHRPKSAMRRLADIKEN
jgi:non-canonical poly(A) RNA polymerase PAPD5/7